MSKCQFCRYPLLHGDYSAYFLATPVTAFTRQRFRDYPFAIHACSQPLCKKRARMLRTKSNREARDYVRRLEGPTGWSIEHIAAMARATERRNQERLLREQARATETKKREAVRHAELRRKIEDRRAAEKRRADDERYRPCGICDYFTSARDPLHHPNCDYASAPG